MTNIIEKKGISDFEKMMVHDPSIELVTEHFFSEGTVYCRKLSVPKGVFISGKMHKTNYLFICAKGSAELVSEKDGEAVRTLVRAGDVIEAGPGKNLGYTLEDSVFINIHSVTSTDVSEIEKMVIETDETVVPLVEGEEI